ncbi:ankyrin repeat domain-containing protein [Pseudonocardia sp.]|uniref:ankyrin repeat domain-containing protein n=1 Tax=Pseudonocardia sp. TaxID=60912 RepID=UPI0039C948BC
MDGTYRLCWAASQGDLDDVRGAIASGVDPRAAGYDGRTALHLAASGGQIEVRYPLQKGASSLARVGWYSGLGRAPRGPRRGGRPAGENRTGRWRVLALLPRLSLGRVRRSLPDRPGGPVPWAWAAPRPTSGPRPEHETRRP